MFKLKDAEGVIHEVEGIDLNVWDSNLYGSGPARGIVVTGYPMRKMIDTGFWHTDTDTILFSADTNFNPEDYDEDSWYGYSEDNLPTDVPFEVRGLVDNIIKEMKV